MLKIGITGGIGSGKSIVCDVFKKLGVPVFHSDEQARILINSNPSIISEIKEYFGNNIYENNNRLNRQKLSEIVFSNKEKLELLNNIIHPRVIKVYKSWLEDYSNCKYILKEAAIIFESESYKDLDSIICVTAPEKIRIKRVSKRDNLTDGEIKKRIKNEISEEERIKRSDYTINNNGTEMILPQIIKLHNKFNK